MSTVPARDRFLELLRQAVQAGCLTKLTLGKYRGPDSSLRNLFVRPVTLKSGPHLSFVWRHATRDITKNHPAEEALVLLETLVGGSFLDAHLFTPAQTAQLETLEDGRARISVKLASVAPLAAPTGHDRVKQHPLSAQAGWLRDLDVTNEHGQPRAGMAPKLRQIQKFAELLQSLLREAGLSEHESLQVADMGSGKGYLTFAVAALLGPRGNVLGIEQRADLVERCNAIATRNGMNHLRFESGEIAARERGPLDVLLALHACDTATDDALASGVASGARLLVVSPCCHKELRPQLTPPPVLAPALRHGILAERQAEFVTDALRALALEAVGYQTRIFEFISIEHTAKNLMLAAVRQESGPDRAARRSLQELAALYGIREQRLARLLDLPLSA